jgi:dipeptidyl aminopeptidase/acylaminoacyl peptidase
MVPGLRRQERRSRSAVTGKAVIPSKFLYFPDENHWVLKPQNSVQWYDEVLGWLDKWTKEGK